MFTGLVETTGKIISRQISAGSGSLVITPQKELENLQFGESIAVNGTCLTLEKSQSGSLYFHVLEETFKRTNLGNTSIGSTVNLERALQVGARMGGHYVTGHIDETASIIAFTPVAGDFELTIQLPESISPYFVEKGSIAIDGISLTLVRVESDRFSVHLIPVTLAETNLGEKKAGDIVNLEADLIGKYVARQLGSHMSSKSTLTMDKLVNAGWS